MEWSKIKNIIILMLCAVNVFLLVLVSVREWKSVQSNEGAREETLSILARSNIEIDRSILPKDLTLTSYTVSGDAETERAQAEGLLGTLTDDAPDARTYTGERGRARFYLNGEFSVEFDPGAYPLGGEAPETVAVRVLGSMGFDARVTGVAEDGTSVTACQKWDGLPIFNCEATAFFEDGELRGFSAGSRRLSGTPRAEKTEGSLTIPTVLMRFLDYIRSHGDLCNAVTGLEAGYVVETQSEPNRLIPMWYLTTDGGKGLYSVNALTGEVKNET